MLLPLIAESAFEGESGWKELVFLLAVIVLGLAFARVPAY
jgi:hypothetical protein